MELQILRHGFCTGGIGCSAVWWQQPNIEAEERMVSNRRLEAQSWWLGLVHFVSLLLMSRESSSFYDTNTKYTCMNNKYIQLSWYSLLYTFIRKVYMYIYVQYTSIYTVYIHTSLRLWVLHGIDLRWSKLVVRRKLWANLWLRSGTPMSMEDRLLVWNWQCFRSLEMISHDEVGEAQKRRNKKRENTDSLTASSCVDVRFL